ncbi:TPA: hypothetical protein SMF46_000556 [Serratia marcescens]|nr:hypothetical protein [Serratia marcescens]
MDFTTQDALDWLNDGIETLKTGEISRYSAEGYARGYELGFLYGTLRTLLATQKITREEYDKLHSTLSHTRHACMRE